MVRQDQHPYILYLNMVTALVWIPPNWNYAPDLLQYYDAKTNIEQELYLIMLEYRQRTFQGAFHASNDYMHWYGWAPLKMAVNNVL